MRLAREFAITRLAVDVREVLVQAANAQLHFGRHYNHKPRSILGHFIAVVSKHAAKWSQALRAGAGSESQFVR